MSILNHQTDEKSKKCSIQATMARISNFFTLLDLAFFILWANRRWWIPPRLLKFSKTLELVAGQIPKSGWNPPGINRVKATLHAAGHGIYIFID